MNIIAYLCSNSNRYDYNLQIAKAIDYEENTDYEYIRHDIRIIQLQCAIRGFSAFKSVEVEEFAKVIADTTVIRLDVRTQEEYAEGHRDNAINIDVKKDDFESKAISALPKDKTIAVYCRGGRRSKKAAKILTANGYTVVELNSGYKGWSSRK